MKSFDVEVKSVAEGVKILDVLADYDLFQFENNIKPDYSNAGGLQMWDEDADGEGNPGWVDWYDKETYEDDPEQFLMRQEIKGANMKPGEYIGKDGRTYRWKHERLSDNSAEGYDHQAHVHEWETEWIDPADWDDAKAALDALIEAESEGWVEIDDNARIQRDGSDPQVRREGGIWWRALTNSIDKRWPKAYRKGREVAEAEQADFRDAVRELVEAVLRAVDNARVDPQTQRDIRNAAKKMEAKL